MVLPVHDRRFYGTHNDNRNTVPSNRRHVKADAYHGASIRQDGKPDETFILRRCFHTSHDLRKIATVAFAAVGLSATLMIGSVARDFATFDNAMLTSASKFSDLDLSIQSGVDTYNRMKTVARQVGATTKFTSAQAAEGLNYLAMAGFNAEQAMVALPQTTNLAIVANTDLARATDITTDSLGAFNLMSQDTAQLQKNLGRVNDVYAKTVNPHLNHLNLDDLFFEASQERC